MKEKIEEVVDYLFKNFEGDELYIGVFLENNNLTRFYESKIHQNMSIQGVEFHLSLAIGKKVGTYSFTNPEKSYLKEYLKRLKEITLNSKEIDDFEGFTPPSEVKDTDTFDEETYDFSEKERVEVVKKIVKNLGDAKGYGIVSTGGSTVFIFNSKGLSLNKTQTDAHITITAWRGEHSGWAEGHSRRIREIDPQKLAERARKKVEFNMEKVEIKPDEYPAILEFPAVGEVISFMGWIGFSAKTYQEKRNFLVGRLGRKLFSEKFNLIDDPFNPLSFNFPFDFEGTPKRRVELIRDGIPINLVYDRRTARKENRESTGHSIGIPPDTFPYPANMEMKGGNKSLDKIIQETEYGIYITRFHYTNVVHPIDFVLTGMTRDGTFLIKDGKIKRPLKNLRFTDSFIKVFSEIEEISEEREVVGNTSYGFRFPSGVLVPAVKVKSIKFSSGTIF